MDKPMNELSKDIREVVFTWMNENNTYDKPLLDAIDLVFESHDGEYIKKDELIKLIKQI